MRRSVEEGAALDEPGLAAALDVARAARRRVDAGAEERRRPRVDGRAELRGAPAGRGAVRARAGSKRETKRADSRARTPTDPPRQPNPPAKASARTNEASMNR